MSDHFQLSRYEVQDAGNGNILVLVSGNRVYYKILTDAFQEYRFSRGLRIDVSGTSGELISTT
mgnify:CR=1 FL=1